MASTIATAPQKILKRVLRRDSVSRLISSIAARSPGELVISDADGNALFGDLTTITGKPVYVRLAGKVVGIVHGAESERVAGILEILAEQSAENRALANDTLEKYKEISMLYDVAERILALPDAQHIASLVCDEASRFLKGDSVTVLLLNEDTERLEVFASKGTAFHSRSFIEISDDVIGSVIKSGVGEIVNDLQSDTRSIVADNSLRSVVCSPLKSTNRVFGVVVVGTETVHHYNAADLRLLNALASQAAGAIEVVRLHGALKQTSAKPADLIYGLDERPPIGVLGILGLQHVCIAFLSLAYPVIIALEAGGSRLDAAAIVSMSLIAMAVATLLQTVNKGPIGSGYLVPHVTIAVFLAPSLLAAKAGGLGLVFGMTLFAGGFGLVFAQLVRRFRKLFPPEVCGVVVLMSGLAMIHVALPRFLGMGSANMVSEPAELTVGLITIGTLVAATVFSLGRIRLYSTIIGIVFGYIAALLAGVVDSSAFSQIAALPVIGVPSRPEFELAFDVSLVIPFAAAVIASDLKAVGLITNCQKANDSNWKRPDMGSVSGGIVADSIGNMTSGMLGGVGTGISSGSVGLTVATGASSRIIALPIAVMFFALAFLPKVTAGLATMPAPIIGAGLIYVACFLVSSGVQLIVSRLLDSRRTFIIGLSVIAGVGATIVPAAFQGAPDWAMVFLGDPLALSTTLAVSLNILLSVGVSKTATLKLVARDHSRDLIYRFMERNGAAWGARPDVIRRATPAITEWHEELAQTVNDLEFNIDIAFDEFRLIVDLDWNSAQRRESRADEYDLAPIAGYLQRQYNCMLKLSGNNLGGTLRLEFEH